jgi:uncharacterized protein
MNDEILEKFIQGYIESQQLPTVSFLWQGGEPTLLGIDFFRKAVSLQKKYAANKQIENSFQTNGTRLDDEWCSFFKHHNFLVGISIDGPEKLHNKYRVYKNGQPTFANVMYGIELLKKHNVDFNTLSVVNSLNSKYPIEVYRFLKSIGSIYMQFLPVVERIADDLLDDELKLVPNSYKNQAEVTEWSVLPEEYGNFMIAIFDEWVRKDVGRYYIQLFDTTLANWVGQPAGLCVFCETCGSALAIEHNGDIYSCDNFVYPQYLLGNITDTSLIEMAASEAQVKFGNDKLNTLPQQCIYCEYRFACHGECPKHRFMKSSDGEDGLSYLCEGYLKFFTHVHPFMQFMSDELSHNRPPANVMQWAKNIDNKKRK